MELTNVLLGISSAVAEEAAPAADAAAQMPAGAGVAEIIVSLLPMVLIIVVFYFMLIRPQRKKEKKTKEMLDSLKVTDRICTIGGIYGTITAIKDDTVTLAVGRSNAEMVVARWAIRSVEDVAIENDTELN